MNKKLVFITLFLMSLWCFSQDKIHIVKAKETLYGISKKYDVAVGKLEKNNLFLTQRGLQIGDRLIISKADRFITVKVKPKQTLYGLSKEYNVSQQEIIKWNPQLTDNGLKIGDKIKIASKPLPVKRSKVPSFYTIKTGDNLYDLSDKFGVTIDQLFAANSNLRAQGFSAGQEIKIPKKSKINQLNNRFVTHKVEPKETMFGLVSYYDLSLDEFVEANPSLQNGLKEGDWVKIPISENAKMPPFAKAERKVRDDTIGLVIILPFHSQTTQPKEAQQRVSLDFLIGARLALQNLMKQGKRIDVKILDSSMGQKRMIDELEEIDISRVDAVIGPLFELSLSGVGTYLRASNTPIISPIANGERLKQNSNVILSQTDKKDLKNELLEDFYKNYKGERIVIISDKTNLELAKETQSELFSKYPDKEIDLIERSSQLKQDSTLVTTDTSFYYEKEPLVTMLFTTNNGFGTEVMNKIRSLDYSKINAYGLGYISFYDPFLKSNRKNLSYLVDLKYKYVTDKFINENGDFEKEVMAGFKNVYCSSPSNYMVLGHDVVYDLVGRMNQNGDVLDWKSEQNRLAFNFKYTKTEEGAYLNQGVKFIRY